MKRSQFFVWATLSLSLAACGPDAHNHATTGEGGAGGQGGQGGMPGTGAGGQGGQGGMPGTGAGGMSSSCGLGFTGAMGGAGGSGSMGPGFVAVGVYAGATGEGNTVVLLEDMNGDGKLDLVVANTLGDFLSIQLGKGDGSFEEHARYCFDGSLSGDLSLADMNGDGKKDVILGMTNAQTGVSVLFSNGDGTLMPPTFLESEKFRALAVADIDGDGDRDVVTAQVYYKFIDTLVNDGSGKLTPGVTLDVGNSFLAEFAVGDVDGDNVEDVVASDHDDLSVTLFKGGAAGLQKGIKIPAGKASSIGLADLSGDGKLDIVIGEPSIYKPLVGVCINKGDGTFAPMKQYAIGGTGRVRGTADVDGDGKLDVLFTNEQANESFVLHNDGDGAFTKLPFTAGRKPHWLAAGDIDGDGDVDLVEGNDGPGLSVLRGDGMGGLLAPSDIPFGGGARLVTTGDFDGDGALDVVFGGPTPQLVSLRGKPGGAFERVGVTNISGAYPNAIFAMHADADGKLDLAAVNECDASPCNTLETLAGVGDGTFHAPLSSLQDFWSSEADVGDLDADGDIDVFVAREYDGSAVMLNNGDGSFTQTTGPNARYMKLADFDNDGILDQLSAFDAGTYVGRGKGDATFFDRVYVENQSFGRWFAVGDVNADGNQDYLAMASSWDELTLVTGAGDGVTFTPNSFALGLGRARAPVIADIDGDGDGDLALIAGARVVILVSEGGSFTAGTIIEGIRMPSSIVVADVDGDKRQDLLVTDMANNSLVVLRNTP